MSLLVSHDMHSPKPTTKQKKFALHARMQEIRFSVNACKLTVIMIGTIYHQYLAQFNLFFEHNIVLARQRIQPIHKKYVINNKFTIIFPTKNASYCQHTLQK